MRRSRVFSCLASSTQQMNSLRARGVMSFQASSAVGLARSVFRRSTGSLCTTPPGTRVVLTPASVPASTKGPIAEARHLNCVQPRQSGRRRTATTCTQLASATQKRLPGGLADFRCARRPFERWPVVLFARIGQEALSVYGTPRAAGRTWGTRTRAHRYSDCLTHDPSGVDLMA
jgi:hypothetical protein